MAIGLFSSENFAGQNWLVTPAALAANETQPSSISDQKWLLVLTGVGLVDLQGNNPNDWRRETLEIYPTAVDVALEHAVNTYGIPRPVGLNTRPAINLEQWSPFAAISSNFVRGPSGVDAGFAVDVWRPRPFLSTVSAENQPVHNIFTGIEVDIAVRNNRAVLHRVSYHITLLGKLVFLVQSGV
jgi:hypothetical protein